ncbi:MAG: hypothetical protein FWF45_04500 [Coriobacteriia bacterium]|nr:hypothetical protein [Coriobacteriia bacterium]
MNTTSFKIDTIQRGQQVRRFSPFMLALALFCLASVLLAPYAQAAAEPVQIPLEINQALRGDGSATPPEATFTYHLTAQSPAAPLPEGSSADGYAFTMTGNAQTSIAPINFVRPGIYTYELYCDPATEPGFIADTQVYTIEMYVTSDLRIYAVVTLSDGNKTSDIRFIQSYSARASDPAIMVDPPVQKIVKGNPPHASMFTFQLKAKDPSSPMPAGSVDGVKMLTIIGSGEKEFGVWSYTKEGVYSYAISEVDTGIKGYTYDMVIYTITDTVKAQDGQLVVERAVTDNTGKRTEVCTFTNHYSALGTIPIVGGILPKTGDLLRLLPYMGFLALALFVIGMFLLLGRRAKRSRA